MKELFIPNLNYIKEFIRTCDTYQALINID